jgi:hypothetical protein
MPFSLDEFSLDEHQLKVLGDLNLRPGQRDTLKRAGALFTEAISYFHQLGDAAVGDEKTKLLYNRNNAYERARLCFQLAGEPELDEGLAAFWRALE